MMATGDIAGAFGARLLRAAQRWPDKPAIVEGSAAISYAALGAAARVITGQLGVAAHGRSGLVCLLFESKTAAVKALVGVSLSGSAYVMLDAGDPDARLRFILEDAAPFVMLTESGLLARATALAAAGCAVLDIDRMGPDGATDALPDVDPDALANLVYTSASTGQPKGVTQTHRNLLFFADAYARALEIGAADRISLLYSLSFGAWNVDIFGGLSSGATVCAYDVRKRGIGSLADWLDEERISILHAVPTVYREMMNRLAPGRVLRHLRVIALGGEAVFDSDIELFRRHTTTSCLFVNQLAATEVSLIAQNRVDHQRLPAPGDVVPAGRCPPGVRVRIQRGDGSEAGRGEIGEILVSSPHLSPGYWRRPELDARVFSEDPVEPGWRRYATGDLGRIDDNGDLCFLGRQGSRIKIRGFTVDLIEIERALAACPGVARCAVVAIVGDRAPEVDRLVAYVTTAPATAPDPRRLRQRLARTLPGYMLPGAFVFRDALPLTSSGKIDRKAMAALEPPSLESTHDFDAPRDDLDRKVASLFGELLKQPRVGRDDDFFLLGGDSLAFTELQLRLRAGHGLMLTSVHDDMTVAGIAARLRALAPVRAAKPIPVLCPLRETGKPPVLFLVHGRLGQALVSPRFVELLGDDQPVWAFQARGLDGLQAPRDGRGDGQRLSAGVAAAAAERTLRAGGAVRRVLRRDRDGALVACGRRGRASTSSARSAVSALHRGRRQSYRGCAARAPPPAPVRGQDRGVSRRPGLRQGGSQRRPRVRDGDTRVSAAAVRRSVLPAFEQAAAGAGRPGAPRATLYGAGRMFRDCRDALADTRRAQRRFCPHARHLHERDSRVSAGERCRAAGGFVDRRIGDSTGPTVAIGSVGPGQPADSRGKRLVGVLGTVRSWRLREYVGGNARGWQQPHATWWLPDRIGAATGKIAFRLPRQPAQPDFDAGPFLSSTACVCLRF
ncbi:MAG: non-ribosomal peptide synthetase [Aromatoleum sp.]|nr:non-ribosomal peptide synthetase [Aromatoleum sp.]